MISYRCVGLPPALLRHPDRHLLATIPKCDQKWANRDGNSRGRRQPCEIFHAWILFSFYDQISRDGNSRGKQQPWRIFRAWILCSFCDQISLPLYRADVAADKTSSPDDCDDEVAQY